MRGETDIDELTDCVRLSLHDRIGELLTDHRQIERRLRERERDRETASEAQTGCMN